MKILVDVMHPAQVLLFKNAILQWRKLGIEVIITSRQKDILLHLLDDLGWQHHCISSSNPGFWGLIKETIVRDYRLYKIVKKEKPRFLLGSSPMITHISTITSAQSIVFDEDDRSVKKLMASLRDPFANYMCTPKVLKEYKGKKHFKHNSTHKLAYLHPNQFKVDYSVLKDLNIEEDEPFFLIRLSSLRAIHDVGESGFTESLQKELITKLQKRGRVFISSEKELPNYLEPYKIKIPPLKIHSVLKLARMFIGDSQSMSVESAVLGTPAIRYSSFAGRLSVLEELEHKYELTYAFNIGQEKEMFVKIDELLNMPDLQTIFKQRYEKMLEDKVDLTQWIINLVCKELS